MSGQQYEVQHVYLSREALTVLHICLTAGRSPCSAHAEIELDNLRNQVQNTLQRIDEPKPDNLDLIG